LRSAELVDKIREIMVKKVVTTGPEASLAGAAKLMMDNRVGSIVVVEKGRLVGIITESDFMRFASIGCDMEKAKVRDHMRKRVITCDPSFTILGALMTMKKHKVRHLPIATKTKKLLGIVSLRDLIAATQLTSIYLI